MFARARPTDINAHVVGQRARSQHDVIAVDTVAPHACEVKICHALQCVDDTCIVERRAGVDQPCRLLCKRCNGRIACVGHAARTAKIRKPNRLDKLCAVCIDIVAQRGAQRRRRGELHKDVQRIEKTIAHFGHATVLAVAQLRTKNTMSTAAAVPHVARIARWTCRLGNNLLQISNALHYATRMRTHVELPAHSSALLRRIAPGTLMQNDPQQPAPTRVKSAVFFYDTDMGDVGGSPDIAQRRALLLVHVTPRLDIPATVHTDPTALYIHIRSGDLFAASNRRPHPEYWQPPLAWYTHIVRIHRDRHGPAAPVVIVTEPDKANPCIAALSSAVDGVTVQSHSIEHDFATLLHAQHVACAYGTFSVMAVLLSPHVRTVHVPVWQRPRPHMLATWSPPPAASDPVQVLTYDLDDYPRGPWRNTAEQRQYMLAYTCKTS